MRKILSILQLALALLVGVAAPQAWAAELNGRLSGKVLDASNNTPLPGAEVVITSKVLIGGAKTTATADDGFFEFVELPPGDYTVEVKYEGVKPIRQQVAVRQGQVTPMRIAWSLELAENQEDIVVEGERLMTKPESTAQGTVLSMDKQSKVASARSYQAVAQQVAGVSGGSNPNVRGANSLMNRYLIDGLDVTDPVTNTFSSNVNFDSISSIAVLTGGMEAQYNSMGGVINLVTSAGSNEYHADASLYANHYMLSAPAQYGSNAFEGIKPFDTTTRPPTQSLQGNLNASGPILKDKLWFAASVQYSDGQSSTPMAAPLNWQAPNRVAKTFLARGKLTWAPNAKNRVTFSGMMDPASFDFRDFSGAGSTANIQTPFAASRQNQGGFLGTAIWESNISDTTVFKLQVGGQKNTIESGPQGWLGDPTFAGVKLNPAWSEASRTYDPNRPMHFNAMDGTYWYNTSSYQLTNRYTLQLDTSIAQRAKLFGQSHEFQAGLQGRLARQDRTYKIPGNAYYVDYGGPNGEAGLCDETTGVGCYQKITFEGAPVRQPGGSFGLYAQDRWKPTEWLTVLPGVRFDWGRNHDSEGRTVSTLYGFGPRIGAVADVTGDQKTIVSAFYGRANEVFSLLAASNASSVGLFNTYDWKNGDWAFNSSSGGPGSTLVDPKNHTAPHTDEFLLSFRRQVAKNTSLGIDYTHKRISNMWDRVETNRILDPTGTRVIGYVNNEPRSIQMITRPDANWVKYQSVDLILEGRPTPEFEFYGAYTLGFRYGPGNENMGQLQFGGSQFTNPRNAMMYDGYASDDIRHQLKLSGAFTSGGFSIGPNLTYSTGTTLTKRYQTNTGVPQLLRSPVGTVATKPNDVTAIAEFRTPDLFDINVRAAYNFEQLTGQKVTLIADAFNVLNLNTPLNFSSSDNTSFGTVPSRMQPLRVQLGVRYQY